MFYLAHCMTVPVNFDRAGAARSGIRQISNVIIFHLWSSFIESHSWLKVIKRHLKLHFVGCFSHYTAVLSALYAVSGSSIIRGAFAIIRGAFTIYIRGAFAIIQCASV